MRAWQNILRATYPGSRVPFRGIFGAYWAGVGVNAITPARGGDIVKLYLVRHRIERSSYPTLGSTLVVETLFDFAVATLLLLVAIQQGLLPGLPDLPGIPAFDWSFAVEHPRFAAVFLSVLVAGAILLVAWASQHVVAFREKVKQGFVVLGDARAYGRQVVTWQALSWVFRMRVGLLLPPRVPYPGDVRDRDRRARRAAGSRRRFPSRPAARARSRPCSSSRSRAGPRRAPSSPSASACSSERCS